MSKYTLPPSNQANAANRWCSDARRAGQPRAVWYSDLSIVAGAVKLTDRHRCEDGLQPLRACDVRDDSAQ